MRTTIALSAYNKLTRQSARELLRRYANRLQELGHREAERLLARWDGQLRQGPGPTNRAEKFNFWQAESYYKSMEADGGCAIREAYANIDAQKEA